jgi:hypothetical protein
MVSFLFGWFREPGPLGYVQGLLVVDIIALATV